MPGKAGVRRNLIWLILGAAMTVVVVISITTLLIDANQGDLPAFSGQVPSRALLMPDRALPRPKGYEKSLVYQGGHQLGGEFGFLGNVDESVSSWGHAHRGDANLVERVQEMPNAAAARNEFRIAPWGRHFDFNDSAPPVTEKIGGLGMVTTTAALSCFSQSSAPVRSCTQWLYRGVYGRYVIDLSYDDTRHDRPLDRNSFLVMARALDKYVAGKLG